MTADQPRRGDTITTAAQLDALWDRTDVLIEATGSYSTGSGTFTECWARPIPGFAGADRGMWEVLVFGDSFPSNLTTSERITSATVLYVPGEQLPSVEDARAEAIEDAAAWIDRLYPNGLIAKKPVLADLALWVDRAKRGLRASGREWAASRAVPSDHTATTEDAALDAATEAVEDEFDCINAGSAHGARDVAEAAVYAFLDRRALLATARPDTTTKPTDAQVERAYNAAFPGLPEHMTESEARRRVRAALRAALREEG